MNGKDLHSLQEAYLEVHQLNEKEDSEYEKASDAALDSRYGYGRAQGDKRSFGRAANRASAAAMLRRLRKDRDEGRETSRESGADAVHQGWAHTARTSEDQTPEKKEKRKKLADTEYKDLPDEEKEKDRVSADAVRAVYNKKKKKDTNEEFEINEAEGSYGQTPKARESYGKLANKRRETPASEYSERGEKTKKVKSAEKHHYRTGNPDAGNRGKKSTKPSAWSGKRSGMTQKDRDEARGGDEYGHTGYDPDWHGGPSAPGGKPKGKKAERQKKTGVSAESFNAYVTVLSYLLDEGFASTENAADKIILNMSESWFENIMELNRYEKETGKDYKTGKEVKKGGTMGGDDTHSKVMRHMHKVMGAGRMGAGGAIQERGKKKEKGKKPPEAGEYGSERRSPEQIVNKRREDKKRGEEMQSSKYD